MTIQTCIQKRKHKVKKHINRPNNETLMSYYMQAIEPRDDAINKAFPEYHPMWLIQSQKKTVSSLNFKVMREFMLKITRKQCAAYLRVSETTVNSWESGKNSVPFMAFELMRLVYESANFRMSHQDWSGWFINDKGQLVCTDTKNLSFQPHDLVYAREVHLQKSFYEAEYKKLRDEVAPLRAEIAELKAQSDRYGVLDELKEIEARLSELSARLSNNKVVSIASINKSIEPLLEVKAA